MAKNDKDDDTIQDDPTVSPVAPSLDQVHAIEQNRVEGEDEVEQEAADAVAANDEDDDADDNSGDESGDGQADSEQDDSGDGDVGDEDDDTVPPVVTPPAPIESTDELNSDITKNGPGKVAIRDSEGNTLYFNNLDEVPDTFDPASYKALMVGTKALYDKEVKDNQRIAEVQAEAERDANVARAKVLEDSWVTDAKELTNSGVLPKGDKNAAAVEEVYSYIESEMKKGNIITSFKQAYKQMAYDKLQTESSDKQKEIDDVKKKRGGIVQSGGGGSEPSPSQRGPGKIIEAPPQGAGLDAIHSNVLRSL